MDNYYFYKNQDLVLIKKKGEKLNKMKAKQKEEIIKQLIIRSINDLKIQFVIRDNYDTSRYELLSKTNKIILKKS